MRFRLSIGTKLLIIFMVVALPLVGIIGVSYQRWYQARIQSLLSERANIARLTGSSFLSFVRELQRTMASDGDAIVSNSYQQADVDRVLHAVVRDYPVATVAWLDRQGEVLSATDPRLVGRNLASEGGIAPLVAGQAQRSLGDFARLPDGTQGFWVAQSVNGRRGTPVGVMAAFVAASRLQDVLPAHVVTGGQNLMDTRGRLVFQNDYPGLAVIGLDLSTAPFVAQALAGSTGSSTDFRYPVVGESRMITEVPVKELGWAAGSSAEVDLELNPVRRTLIFTIIASALVMLVALAVSLFMGRGIVSSLRYIQRSAREVGAGNLHASIAITTGDEVEDVARSLDETRRRLARTVEDLAGLAEAGRQLTSSLEIETVRVVIARSARRLFGAVSTWVLVPDDRTGELRGLFASGAGADGFGRIVLSPGKGVGGRVFLTGERVVVPDVSNEPGFVGADEATRAALRQIVELPLITKSRVSGVLALAWLADAPAVLDERELELLEAFAAQTSIALENARLYQERRRAGTLGDALNEANVLLNASPSAPEGLTTVLERSAAALGCDAAAVFLEGPSGCWTVPYASGGFSGIRGQRRPLRSGLLSGLIPLGTKPVVVDDVVHDRRFSYEEVVRHELRSLTAVPLGARDETSGVLLFAHQTAAVAFSPVEVDFAAKLGASISLALENARLYEAERRIADTLQEALLTVPEGVKGCDFGTLYRSATELSRVGGDFFDLFEVDGGRLIVLIGDVSGKGLEAASLTSLVKNVIRIYAYESRSPSEILAKTNAFLTRDARTPTFVTVFLGVVHKETGDLAYASAGHPPALLRRSADGVVHLSSGSTVLGVFADEVYVEARASMGEGATLLLYTDGAIEARDAAGEMFGEERLAELMVRLHGTPARELPERLFHTIMEFTDGRLDDDLALLALSLTGPEVEVGAE